MGTFSITDLQTSESSGGQSFTATLLLDGHPIGTVSNEGEGGINSYDLCVNIPYHDTLALLAREAVAEGFDSTDPGDSLIWRMVEDVEVVRTLNAKRAWLYLPEGDEASFWEELQVTSVPMRGTPWKQMLSTLRTEHPNCLVWEPEVSAFVALSHYDH